MRREDENQLPAELASALDALAGVTAGRNAPARVEMAALAAFRHTHAGTANTTGRIAPSRPPLVSRAWIVGSVAAGLAALIGLGVAFKGEQSKPAAPSNNGVVATSPEHRVIAAPPEMGGGDPVPVTPPPSQRQWPEGRNGGIQQVRNTVRPDRATPEPRPTEIATDYYPLVSGDDLAQLVDGGQVVRMQVPRESLASFGFQMDAGSGNRLVTADVVLGNDGVARAIRFVQPLEIAMR